MRPTFCSIVLLALCAELAIAADWNQWRGPNRDGSLPQSPPLLSALPEAGLKPQWKSEEIPSARQGGWSSPVVSGGKVYVFAHTKALKPGAEPFKKKYPWLAPDKRTGMSAEEYAEYERKRRDEDERLGNLYQYVEIIYCIDADSGKTVWKNEEVSLYTRFLHSGSPAVIDGRIYILGAGLRPRCVSAETGKTLWKTQLPGEFRDEFMMSSFAVADGVASVLAGQLFGLDAETGKILWEGDPKTTRGTHSSPVVWQHDGQEYFIANVGGSDTICVEPKTGKELWRVHSQARLSTPIVRGDLLLTYGDSRKKGLRCYRLTPASAEEMWVYQGAADKGSSPVVVGDYVYVQGERRLACVSLKDGKQQWSTLLDLSRPQYTSLIAADNKVFYGHGGVLMFEATPERFRPLAVGKIDGDGLLATEESFRKKLGLDELEKTPAGQRKALQLYEKTVGNNAPLRCATPAIAGGKIFVRLKDSVACWDLSADTAAGE